MTDGSRLLRSSVSQILIGGFTWLMLSHDPGSGLAGVLFVKESYVVPPDVQCEALPAKPLQFSGLKFGVNLRHDKCTVVPNRVHSVANLGNSFFRHADSSPQSGLLRYPYGFQTTPYEDAHSAANARGNRFPTHY
jgi:hypothetical protein